MQLMFAIWRRALVPMVWGAHNSWDWSGLAWLIEVRGLANRSEGLANRSERLGGRTGRTLSIKVGDSLR